MREPIRFIKSDVNSAFVDGVETNLIDGEIEKSDNKTPWEFVRRRWQHLHLNWK
jgi:hypothetical protein